MTFPASDVQDPRPSNDAEAARRSRFKRFSVRLEREPARRPGAAIRDTKSSAAPFISTTACMLCSVDFPRSRTAGRVPSIDALRRYEVSPRPDGSMIVTWQQIVALFVIAIPIACVSRHGGVRGGLPRAARVVPGAEPDVPALAAQVLLPVHLRILLQPLGDGDVLLIARATRSS